MKKKRAFRKFSYRGVDLEELVTMPTEKFVELCDARVRRRFSRGLKARPASLIKRIRKSKKACGPDEKPEVVKTHLRDMIIVPEMIGANIGVHNGKAFNQVEIKPEM